MMGKIEPFFEGAERGPVFCSFARINACATKRVMPHALESLCVDVVVVNATF